MSLADEELRNPADAFLASVLKSGPSPWPGSLDAGDGWERIAYHGIAPLLHAHPALTEGWPAAVAGKVREEAIAHAFWEDSHRHAVGRAVRMLGEAGVATVVMKGTALAYSLYDDPSLRPRGDSDILVRCSAARASGVFDKTFWSTHTSHR